ncbi:MAG: zinc-dependent alcohol dehydrogenase family protein [Gammaproteobacteria bacterium]
MPKAWVIHEYSGYQGLVLEAFPVQEPGPGEVRLKVEAFALNWGDMDLMHDRYSFSFPEFPAKIGMEAAGIVEAVGPGVEGIEIGTRYSTLPHFYYNGGASAESLVINARYLTPSPTQLSAVESASIWMQYMTAYFPIAELSAAQAGDYFLIPAGTSTAGTAALEIGSHLGATMITTSRFDYNEAYLRDAGADHIFVQGQGNLAEYLMEVTDGKGIKAAFDPIGAGMIQQYGPALARDATIYFYGLLDAKFPEALPLVDMFQSNATFRAYSLFNYVNEPAARDRGITFVNEALQKGWVKPRIDRVYPMQDYIKAWDYLRQPRQHHGKVVIETGL